MKKNIALITAIMLLTGCTNNTGSVVSTSAPESSTASQTTQQTTQSDVTSSQPDDTAEPPSTEPVNTAEPLPTEEVSGADSTAVIPVKAQYLEDVSDLGEHDEFSINDEELTVKVVFTADTVVTDFRVLSISMQDYDDEGNFTFAVEDMYTQPELTPERPLEAGLVFLGDIPNNGIAFTAPDGNTKYYTVDMSGRDGSLFLWEISVGENNN